MNQPAANSRVIIIEKINPLTANGEELDPRLKFNQNVGDRMVSKFVINMAMTNQPTGQPN